MINMNMSDANNTESALGAIEKRIADLRNEQEQLTKVCAHLTQFLRANSLNPINDDVVEYTELFIKEEKIKRNNGAQNENIIDGLQKLLEDYRHEMIISQQAVQMSQMSLTSNTSTVCSITQLQDIFALVESLYRLPINGAKIRAQVDESKNLQQKFTRDREQMVDSPVLASCSNVMSDLKRILL